MAKYVICGYLFNKEDAEAMLLELRLKGVEAEMAELPEELTKLSALISSDVFKILREK